MGLIKENTMKKFISILLSLLMVVCIFPLTALAGGGLGEVSFYTTLNKGGTEYVTVDSDAMDTYVVLDAEGSYWTGPSVGFNMYLEAGVPYVFCADLWNEAASYIDRAIAIFPEDLSSDYPLAYNTVNEYSTGCRVYTFYTPLTTGYYNLLVWGYAEDSDELELDGTQIAVTYDVDKYWSVVDFSNDLYEDEAYVGEVLESDPYIDVCADIEWSGYAKGFTVYLESDTMYTFSTTVSHPDATYADRAIALFSEEAFIDYDYLEYSAEWFDESSATVSFTYTPYESGYYKLLVWGYIRNENVVEYDLFEGTELSVEFSETILYGIDFTTELTLGEAYNDEILESDPFIYHNSWSGYAKGFNIDLEANVPYNVSFRGIGNEETVAYFDRAVAVFDENNRQVYFADSYNDGYDFILNSVFIPEKSGNYKILFWGYCDDVNDAPLFGYENADCYYLVEERETTEIDISNADELIKFGQDLSNGVYDTLVVGNIVADINMTGREWNPITSSIDFVLINGNGHTIKGLCDSLIYGVGGDVYFKDLTVYSEAAYLGTESNNELYNFGALVGYCNNATFINCNLYGSATFENFASVDSVGGLFGNVENITANNCHVEFDITIKNTDYIDDIGGIGGYVDYVCTLDNVDWIGDISIDNIATEIYEVGGIVGTIYSDGIIENVSAEGSITIESEDETGAYCSEIGGLFGYIEDYNTFNNCASFVDINAPVANCVGGIVGMLDEENLFYNSYSWGSIFAYATVGGFAGDSSCCGYNEFVNCYTISDVSGEYNVGGFIGYAYEGDYIVNCYATGSVVGSDDQSVGMFLGYSNYEIHFGNVYASIDDDFDVCGLGYTFDTSYIYVIDYSDEEDVSIMENYLNDTVASINESGSIEFEFKYWEGRNPDNAPAFEEPRQYLLGDANCDGTVDSSDYVLVKRYCFNTYELDETGFITADVNGDGTVNSSDYLLIKRICFNTYIVE